MTPLVRRLIEIQGERNESDRQFAAALGLDWSYWSYIRRGQRTGGKRLIGAACHTFPELRSLIGQEWSNGPKIVDDQPVEKVSA